MTRTWFITGANRGLGRAFVDVVAGNGDRVVATARDTSALAADLADRGDNALVLELDVSDRAAVHRVVDRAVEAMGRLDVVVNNAGYGLSGGIEETTEAEARAQMDTNFFGALWVTQAALPHLRRQGSGHLVQISSIAGVIAPPSLGVYAASKWALEAMSEAVAAEVSPFGIGVTLAEPGGIRTEWAGTSMRRTRPSSAYDEVLAPRRAAFDPANAPQRGADPGHVARAVVDAVTSANPPLRLPLGAMAWNLAHDAHERRLAAIAPWERVARGVDGSS